MKLLSSVVWSEGMYLGPHHFQVQNRYFQDAMRLTVESLWGNAFGFTDVVLDSDALRSGTVAVRHARGVFPEGLPFDMPECDPLPEPRAVGDSFLPTRDFLEVSLSIPRAVPAGQNCALEAAVDGKTRYVAVAEVVNDENTGRDEKPLQVGRKNIRFVFDTEDTEGMELLPIAHIRRGTTGDFVLDARFIPPILQLTASEPLMVMLRRLIEILEEKSPPLERAGAGRFQAGMSAHEVATFWFRHAINSALAPLRHLYAIKRGHPEELFQEMSRLAGALCTFGLDSHPRTLPAYDHNQLQTCFDELDRHIREHLEIILPSQAIAIPLVRSAPYFYEGNITDTRALGAARWLLGVRSTIGEADLIQKAPAVVKICSAKFVPELVKRALPGMPLMHVPVPPSAIGPKVEYQYFSISRVGACWEHIMQTRCVGIYVPGDLGAAELELLVVLES